MNFAFKTIHEFHEYFKDERTCYEFFEQIRWAGVPVCPHCGSIKTPYKVKARGKFQDIPSYRCSERQCDLPFTVRTKSIFEGSKVEFKKWLQAAYEISTCKNGISSVELAARIGVSQKTGWFINHRLRDMLKETQPELLRDVVQIDGVVMGGKEKNKHADKKIPGSAGRSLKGKTALIGARGLLGQVKAEVVRDEDGATILPLAKKWIAKGAIMISDEWKAYNVLKEDYFHVKVNHKDGAYVNGCFTTNGVENFWSLLKRGILGTFHSVSPQHLQAYVNEFSDRYNKKNLNNIERFGQVIERAKDARITYKQLTARKQIIKDFLTYRRDDF